MSHTCHSPDCTRPVPPRMLFCLPHWRIALAVENLELRVTRMPRPSPAADLFVMVKNLPHVWRLRSYDDDFLHLDSLDRLHTTTVLKTLCRVGEAKHWRGSRFAEAWEAGGGAP